MHIAAGQVKLSHVIVEGLAAELYLDNILLRIVTVDDAVRQLLLELFKLRLLYVHIPDGEHRKAVKPVKRAEILNLVAVKVERSD